MGQCWHEYHFTCGGPCKKPMSGSAFFERDGKPYCKEDFEQIFAAKCQGCSRPISDKAIIALEAKWHKDCFKCKVRSKCNSFSQNVLINFSFQYRDAKNQLHPTHLPLKTRNHCAQSVQTFKPHLAATFYCGKDIHIKFIIALRSALQCFD